MSPPRAFLGAVTTVAAAAALLVAAAASAGATGADSSSVVWQPLRSEPITVAAGLACTFPLHLEPVVDEEEIATFATFPDGTPRVQAVRGGLRTRFTNLDTGVSVERDLDGIGVISYEADGSNTWYFSGPAAVGFRPTDGYPAGFYVLDGFHVVHTAPERTNREMRVDAGSEENICDALIAPAPGGAIRSRPPQV
jgi:hypothetical protein